MQTMWDWNIVYIFLLFSLKHLKDDGPNVVTRASEAKGENAGPRCLIRAHAGKLKLSALVCILILIVNCSHWFQIAEADRERFQAQFAEIMKRRLDGLKKKAPSSKKKRRHGKATQ